MSLVYFQYLRGVIVHARVNNSEKDDLFQQFQKIVHSKSVEEFQLQSRAFKNLAYGVEIVLDEHEDSLVDYYERCWEPEKEKWVACFRSSLETLGDSTNNREVFKI